MPLTTPDRTALAADRNDGRRSSARQSTLRESNLALVARIICASPVPLSRAGVAARTSMTRSTASRLVDDLVAGGVLAELEPPAVAGPGRPAIPLVAGRGLAALGLQVNASYLAARVVNLRGQVIAESVEYDDFIGSAPGPTLARLARLAGPLLSELPGTIRLVGSSLALPGIVSTDAGHLLLAPNLGWSDLYPSRLLGPRAFAGLRLRIGNEADLAARTVAEVAPGRPGSLSDFIYLSGEIGIGGAAVVDGQVMAGRHGWAGEIGHLCVDPDGPPCPCGSTGCLEQYAGKHAILTAAGLSRETSAEELADRARAGEPAATEAVAGAARALAVALAGAINVLDIPTVVLGGHLGQIADILAPDLEEQLRPRVLSTRWVSPTIGTSGSEPAAGATGGAMRELSSVLANPTPWVD